MLNKRFIARCIAAAFILMPTPMQAQKAMFVHTASGWLAHDANNIDQMFVSADTVSIETDAVYLRTDIDSIVFTEPSDAFRHVGWWGNLAGGHAVCYHGQASDEPCIETWATDSICLKAYCADSPMAAASRGPRKVGGKWRYVRGTLSGQHKLCSHAYDYTPYGGFDLAYNGEGKTFIDLSPLLKQRPMNEVRRAVNFWYQPTIQSQMPLAPLFGQCEYDGDGLFLSHAMTLPGDSVTILVKPVYEWKDDQLLVVGDSMTISYKTDWMVARDFEEFSHAASKSLRIGLHGNSITVVETFEPVAPEEVRRWLVRYDLDMHRPVFIRSGE